MQDEIITDGELLKIVFWNIRNDKKQFSENWLQILKHCQNTLNQKKNWIRRLR